MHCSLGIMARFANVSGGGDIKDDDYDIIYNSYHNYNNYNSSYIVFL